MRYKRLMIFDQFTGDLGREVEKRGLSEEELMAELEETKREVFLEQYGRPEILLNPAANARRTSPSIYKRNKVDYNQ